MKLRELRQFERELELETTFQCWRSKGWWAARVGINVGWEERCGEGEEAD